VEEGQVNAMALAESAKWDQMVELLSAALRAGNEAVSDALMPLLEELAKAVHDSPLQLADVFLLAAHHAAMVDPQLGLEGPQQDSRVAPLPTSCCPDLTESLRVACRNGCGGDSGARAATIAFGSPSSVGVTQLLGALPATLAAGLIPSSRK
jgi:hypothetical protein